MRSKCYLADGDEMIASLICDDHIQAYSITLVPPITKI